MEFNNMKFTNTVNGTQQSQINTANMVDGFEIWQADNSATRIVYDKATDSVTVTTSDSTGNVYAMTFTSDRLVHIACCFVK